MAVCPGFTDTPLVRRNLEDEMFRKAVFSVSPKLIEVDSVARAMLDLVLDASNAGRAYAITHKGARYAVFPDDKRGGTAEPASKL